MDTVQFNQIDSNAIRALFKELERKLDELRGHL
jgi:hypothetical protein